MIDKGKKRFVDDYLTVRGTCPQLEIGYVILKCTQTYFTLCKIDVRYTSMRLDDLHLTQFKKFFFTEIKNAKNCCYEMTFQFYCGKTTKSMTKPVRPSCCQANKNLLFIIYTKHFHFE